jgi:hypothetical protein
MTSFQLGNPDAIQIAREMVPFEGWEPPSA